MLFKSLLNKSYDAYLLENIHVIKTGIAFILGYLVTFILPEQSPWALITIAMIMISQAVLGLQINKAFMRMLGTLIGAFSGIVTMSIMHNKFYLLIILTIYVIIASKLALRFPNFNYACMLGVVTFLLVIFIPNDFLSYAIYRIIDILCGIIICLVVSVCIFPLNAKRSFLLSIKSNFKNLDKLIYLVFIEGKERQEDAEIIALESKIGAQLTEQRNLIKADSYEKIQSKTIQTDLFRIHRCQRAIFHYLIFIDVVIYGTRKKLSPEFIKQFNQFIISLMLILGKLEIKKAVIKNSVTVATLDAEFSGVENLIQEYLKDKTSSFSELQSINTLLFILGRLKVVLDVLIKHWNAELEK